MNHAYIKCVRFASWSLPKLLTSLLHGFLACLPTLWYCFALYICGKMKGLVEGLCREEKISLCIRCNPKLCIESQAFVLSERTLYLCERMIWVYWDLSLVRVSLHHLYSLHLSVKFLLVAAHRFRLKVELDKFLVLSCVCVSIFLSTLLRSFLLFGEIFQMSIIFSQLIVWIATQKYFS